MSFLHQQAKSLQNLENLFLFSILGQAKHFPGKKNY
jgi:hypothetical protein